MSDIVGLGPRDPSPTLVGHFDGDDIGSVLELMLLTIFKG